MRMFCYVSLHRYFERLWLCHYKITITEVTIVVILCCNLQMPVLLTVWKDSSEMTYKAPSCKWDDVIA